MTRWFHAKRENAGFHVIVKTNGDELPIRLFEEAGRLAAYYSKGKKLERRLTICKRKTSKSQTVSKTDLVVYYTNYQWSVKLDIAGIQQTD